MVIPIDTLNVSLGCEPKEVLGFETDQQLEEALKPLMELIPLTDEKFEGN